MIFNQKVIENFHISKTHHMVEISQNCVFDIVYKRRQFYYIRDSPMPLRSFTY